MPESSTFNMSAVRGSLRYEARGDQHRAAGHYRLALRIIDAHSGDYDPEIRAHYVNKLNMLDPSNNPPTMINGYVFPSPQTFTGHSAAVSRGKREP